MPRGGRREGAGRPKKIVPERAAKANPSLGTIDPKDYLQGVVDGRLEFDEAKFRAAKELMPYCHARLDKAVQSKKEEAAERSRAAAVGSYAPPEPPKLVVNNG